MSRGDVVLAPTGEEIVLVDVGQVMLADTPATRVWEVALRPGEVQPWHLHHNPYVVLSLEASPGRMDWLDGSEPRLLNEYRGGAVFRPISPVHRLTNIGDTPYRNRLVEFKDLGENRGDLGENRRDLGESRGKDGLDVPAVDVGPGDRSVEGRRPGPSEPDGRQPVLLNAHTRVWEVVVGPGSSAHLDLSGLPHVVASFDAPARTDDPAGGVRCHDGGPLPLHNESGREQRYFVLELSYLAEIRKSGDPEGRGDA